MIKRIAIVKLMGRQWEVCCLVCRCSDLLLLLDLLLLGILKSLFLLLDVIVNLSLVDLNLLLPIVTLSAFLAVYFSDLFLLGLLQSFARLASLGNIA